MTGNDPTDHALAMIASIFEKPARPEPKVRDDAQAPSSEAREQPDAQQEDAQGDATAEGAQPDDAQDEAVQAPDREDAEAADVGEQAVGAADSEILDSLGSAGDTSLQITTTEQIITTETVEITVTQVTEPPMVLREDGTEDLDALTRFGPGPLDALRFKWSVRHGFDGYYVDETIGTSSQPIVAGPFSRADAIAHIEARDRRTRRRFERLRNEIISGPSERGVEDDDDEML